MSKKIRRIAIDKYTGEVSIEGIGYNGRQCHVEIDELERLIGGQTISKKNKVQEAQVARVAGLKR